MIRLQKVLADRGVASRRRAEELITAGRVRVNGQVVTTLGTKVEPSARIAVDDVPTRAAAPRYIALNKPKGIYSTASDERGIGGRFGVRVAYRRMAMGPNDEGVASAVSRIAH